MSQSNGAPARSARLIDSPLLWATVAIYSLGLPIVFWEDLMTVARWMID